MSSLSEAELAEFAKESFTENCCASAALGLLIYDWVITLGQEARYIWSSKFKGYTALFFLNRINMAGMIIGLLLGLTPWYTGEAAVLVLASFQIMTFFTWAVVSSLRVYAISNRGFSLALVTLALGLVPVGTNLFNYIESSYFVSTYSLFVECEYSQKFSDAIGFRLLIFTRVSVIVADAVVLFVSWRHLHGTLKTPHVGANRISLGALLLRDDHRRLRLRTKSRPHPRLHLPPHPDHHLPVHPQPAAVLATLRGPTRVRKLVDRRARGCALAPALVPLEHLLPLERPRGPRRLAARWDRGQGLDVHGRGLRRWRR
ncbi:hypothetical protein C8Q72DRAFT_566109 [Fomitopsis betulina]|nr:hypothetical protein C8Q72DRAFT_566109 [Fomitopsis betulina]